LSARGASANRRFYKANDIAIPQRVLFQEVYDLIWFDNPAIGQF
jgi:hypothetical protein